MAQPAVEGDEEALEYLSLQESEVNWTTASTLTWETLCANYNYCAHVLVVASHLQLHDYAQNIALCSPEFDVLSRA